MTRVLRRYIRPARLLLIWVAIIFAFVIVLAFLLGVNLDGTGPQPVSPATATRNFWVVAPGVFREVMPFLVQGIFLLGINIFIFGGIFWFLSKGVSYTIFPGEYGETFDDVRGQPHIVGATKEVMKLFQGYKEFQKVGGYPPHGILFEGPPGTGKTLMAKAIAGETGVPFMYASGAGFTNMFMGVSQLRVKSMFRKGRIYAERWGGCVMFIDELDSLGMSRGGVANRRSAGLGARGIDPVIYPGGMGMGGDSSMVNMLLTQMDGIDQPKRMRRFVRRIFRRPPGKVRRANLLVIGATNRASTLDPALLRPGRFDRKIHVGNPGEEGRKDIIAYYLNKTAHVPIDIDRVARATSGYSPARIKNILNEALIFARQEGRDALTYDDIWKAKLIDEIGLVEPVDYSEREKFATGIHESGHAIAAFYLRPWMPVQIVTIRKRGETLGLVHSQEDEERHADKRSDYLTHIRVSMAGMVAEEMWLGESTEGTAGDLRNATEMALRMVAHIGMGSTLFSLGALRGRQVEDDYATIFADEKIRNEIDGILKECKASVRELLEQKRAAVEAVCDALVKTGELTGDEFRNILWRIGASAEPPIATQLPLLPMGNFGGDGGYGNGHGSGNGNGNGGGYPNGYPYGYGYPFPGYGGAPVGGPGGVPGPGMTPPPPPPPINRRSSDVEGEQS